MFIYLLILFFLSFFAQVIFVNLLNKIGPKHKALNPSYVPLVGGLSMGLAFILMCFFSLRVYGQELPGIGYIIITSFLMLVVGVADDLWELSVVAKFLTQLVATALLIYFGVRTRIVYIGIIPNIIITFVWVIGITNAFNLLDIMDGLAAGTAILISLAFFSISMLNKDYTNTVLSLVIFAVTLSYFIYNFPPARIYMGNTGSHFLGFLFASIAIAISYAPMERKVALVSPLLIMGMPIFDTIFLILMRIKKGRMPFFKSNDHLVFRLMEKGCTKRKSLFYMLTLNTFFCVCGVILSKVSNVTGLAIILVVISVSVLIAVKMSKEAVNG